MDLAFALRGIEGHVSVFCRPNDRPELVGSGPDSRGFPLCHAVVAFPAQGYDAVLGWVQLVRSDDNTSQGREFEIDPLAFLGDLPHPFCWLGLAPQLFDAPSRSPKQDLDWLAHSFLCVPDGRADEGLDVHALVGFSWGFTVRREQIELVPPAQLGPEDWDAHHDLLSALYPAWGFVAGYRAD